MRQKYVGGVGGRPGVRRRASPGGEPAGRRVRPLAYLGLGLDAGLEQHPTARKGAPTKLTRTTVPSIHHAVPRPAYSRATKNHQRTSSTRPRPSS